MIYTYVAKFYEEENSYWAEFPDLEGCFTQGKTLSEVLANASESLECYLESLLENGEKLSKPQKITDVDKGKSTFLSYVSCNVDLAKYSKSIKKTLTIPAWLNDKAVAANINFSQTLAEALLKKVES